MRSYGPDEVLGVCVLWPSPRRNDLWSRSWHPWVMDNNYVRYNLDPTWQWRVMARTHILSMCALWHWFWRYDLGQSSGLTFGSWTTIVWNIIQIELWREELWSGHRFSVCVHCDLVLGDMTLRQGHDTLGSCTTNVWNIYILVEVSCYIIEIGQEGKKLWPRDNVNRRTDRHTDKQTDRQIYRVIPIYPQTLFGEY